MTAGSMQARLAVVVGIGVAVVTMAQPAFASGKGPGSGKTGGGSSSMTLVNETAPGAAPAFGQTIRFDVSTTATTQPHVSLACTQNGSVVYSTQTGYYASYPWPWTQNMTLSSGAWTGGPASCDARLYAASNSGNTTTLAILSFAVSA